MLRKVVRVGSSRAIVIPVEIFKSLEQKGKTFKKVNMEIAEDKFVITPILEDI